MDPTSADQAFGCWLAGVASTTLPGLAKHYIRYTYHMSRGYMHMGTWVWGRDRGERVTEREGFPISGSSQISYSSDQYGDFLIIWRNLFITWAGSENSCGHY